MTDLQDKSAQEVIIELQRRNRNFKIATTLFMLAAAIAMVVIIVVGLASLERANQQLASQKQLLSSQSKTLKAISDAADQRTDQLAKISSQIDCIAQFFTRGDRTNVVITDLQQCKILNPDGSITHGTGLNTTTTNSTGTVTTQPQSQAPSSSQQPAATTPPDDTPTPASADNDTTTLNQLPLVGGLLKRLGL